jgi:hypothetical protein
MNPLHEGSNLSDIDPVSDIERSRIESVDLSSEKRSARTLLISEHEDPDNDYNTVATAHPVGHGDGHGGHGHESMAPSRLPEGLQNFLEKIFKLKKRGTTFEVTCQKDDKDVLYCMIILVRIDSSNNLFKHSVETVLICLYLCLTDAALCHDTMLHIESYHILM